MEDGEFLARRFEEHRAHLRSVAYRMLGSLSEADDAVQEAWIRLDRSGADEIDNLGGWLTTVVARVCLNQLRSRERRREESIDVHVPDPIVTRADAVDPAEQALLADSVGLALLVVLETLAPPERLAFVLHDMFAVPFDDIAPIVGRSPEAARQLASRARRRIQGEATTAPDSDRTRQREVVDAFFAAARSGDFDALVAVLDPDVVLRSDGGPVRAATRMARGAAEVAGSALRFADPRAELVPVLVNGTAGVVVVRRGQVVSVLGFTVAHGRIVEIDAVADRARLRAIDLDALRT